jgi:ribosomal protein S18 acetylase RimI-like enzyme
VREAGPADIAILVHHRVAMFRDMGALPAQQERELELRSADWMRDALPRGEYLAWVAEDGADPPAIIGGAGVQVRPILPRPDPAAQDVDAGPEALVVNVYVEPAWRRRGVAEAVMRALLEDLAARGIRRVVLHTSDDGRPLYERLGFAPTNEMRLRGN